MKTSMRLALSVALPLLALSDLVHAHPGHDLFMSSLLHDFLHALESSALMGGVLTVVGVACLAVNRYRPK